MGRSVAAALMGFSLLFFAYPLWPAETQSPQKEKATYVGNEVCKGCHAAQFEKFSKTLMGKIFVFNPRNDLEKQACESCHGPGSKYTPYKTEHEKDYKRDEAVKLGLVVPDEKGCLKCHRGGPDGSPTMKADEKFDAAAKMKEDGSVHVHPKK